MNQEWFKCLHTMCKNNQGENFLCICCHRCVQLPCAEHVHVRQASAHTSPVHFPLHIQIHVLYSPSLQQGRISQNQQSHFSGSVYYTGQKHQTGFVNKLYRSTCYMYQQTLTAEVTDFNGGLTNLKQNLPHSQLQLTKWKDFCFHPTTKNSYLFLRVYCYP